MAKFQREFESILKEEGLNETVIKKYNDKGQESVEPSSTSTSTNSSVEYESDNEPPSGEVSDDATY